MIILVIPRWVNVVRKVERFSYFLPVFCKFIMGGRYGKGCRKRKEGGPQRSATGASLFASGSRRRKARMGALSTRVRL